MSSPIPCMVCKKGIYVYSEPDREDWENREMTCTNCGNKDTIRQQTDRFWKEVDNEKRTV